MRRRPQAHQPIADRGHLAQQSLGLADALTHLLRDAAALHLPTPPAVANTVHDLRGWACRISDGTAAGPVAVDTTRIIAYLRGLPDQQLLALLADLPWSRLDALLDAVQMPEQPSSGWRQSP